MRSIFLRTLFLCMPCFAFAQSGQRAFAPDFELVDLNGQTWHLYEILESGKHVILDFSATWCSPCWDYHETGVLNEAYTLYGPDGTDELMIFMIEGDDETNLECLYDLPGCSSTTKGDWTAGTLYPIINDDNIADEYEIQGWPSHFHICPTKIITRTYQPDLEMIEYFMESCAEPVGQQNASILSYSGYAGEFCRSISTRPAVKVKNLGHQTMERASASCYINGELQGTTTWQGHVIPFDTFTLSLPEITIDEAATILVRIDSVNEVADDDMSDNEIAAGLTTSPPASQNVLQLELKTYSNPQAVYWEVTNSDHVVLYHGGNPTVIGKEDDGGTYTGANTVYITPIPLPGEGCYKYAVYDANGGNSGVDYYRITGLSGELLAQAGWVDGYRQELFNIQQAGHVISGNGALTKIHGAPAAVCSQEAYTFSVDVLNLGVDNITDIELELLENNTLLAQIAWSGDVVPSSQATIAFPPVTLMTGHGIIFRIKSVNNSVDAHTYRNEVTLNLPHYHSEDNTLMMEIKLDPWAYENYWQLTNSSGEVLYSGGNTNVGPNGGGLNTATSSDPGAYSLGELIKLAFQLPDNSDCYTFLLVDSDGNGLYNGAYMKLSEKETGKLIYRKDYVSAHFDTEEVLIDVDLTTVSIPPVAMLEDLVVYPNPADTELHLRFETDQTLPLKVSITNVMGQTKRTFPEVVFSPGKVNHSLDVHDLPSGVYVLHFAGEDESILKNSVNNLYRVIKL